MLEVGKHIVRSEGVRGLFRGGVPRTILLVSAGCIFFPTYEFTKGRVLEAAGRFSTAPTSTAPKVNVRADAVQ